MTRPFDLYEQAEKRVLLSFHPLAWTEYCAAQMISLEEKPGSSPLSTAYRSGSVSIHALQESMGKVAWDHRDPAARHFWPHGAVAMNTGSFRDENGFPSGRISSGREAEGGIPSRFTRCIGAGYREIFAFSGQDLMSFSFGY